MCFKKTYSTYKTYTMIQDDSINLLVEKEFINKIKNINKIEINNEKYEVKELSLEEEFVDENLQKVFQNIKIIINNNPNLSSYEYIKIYYDYDYFGKKLIKLFDN